MERFNTVNGKYCYNRAGISIIQDYKISFNTVNGKYCCNSQVLK